MTESNFIDPNYVGEDLILCETCAKHYLDVGMPIEVLWHHGVVGTVCEDCPETSGLVQTVLYGDGTDSVGDED